jgi:hypothetical protein
MSRDPAHLPPEPVAYDWQADDRAAAEADARNDEAWLTERGVYQPPVLVILEISYAQVRALLLASNGEPLNTDQRSELTLLATRVVTQVRKDRADVKRLLGDMGADGLVKE